jgi:hypothetical protein
MGLVKDVKEWYICEEEWPTIKRMEAMTFDEVLDFLVYSMDRLDAAARPG